jgi:pyruvate/2-oxoacid:ferredoxin oxidoreductase alpha subunit
MAMIRYGADGYFGYPITPQSEVLEKLEEEMPWDTTGMVVLQAESEVAAINMVYGGAMTGKAVCTSTSSPGFSLMQEGVSYLAASEVPALLINVQRGGSIPPANSRTSPLQATLVSSCSCCIVVGRLSTVTPRRDLSFSHAS